MTALQRPVLLYDADCRVCRFAARTVLRLDVHERLAFLPLEADEAASLLEPLPEAERFASWRLASPDGTLVGRGAGTSSVLRAIGRGRSARLVEALPDALLERVYDLVAHNRSRLGRISPAGPAPRRFP
jgi:predicted DCC family thiol-disulfide oxidoreductase YuxK